MKKLIAFTSILVLSACSSSNSIRSYLPDVNWSNLDPIGQGTLKAYEGNLLTVRNQCDSMTDTLNSKPLSRVLNSNRDRKTLLRNAANLDYMKIRQDIYLSQSWLNYIEQDMYAYKNVSSRMDNILDSDTVVEVDDFRDVARSMLDLCREHRSKVTAVVTQNYIGEEQQELFSDVLNLWLDENRRIYRQFITKEGAIEQKESIQTFRIKGDTAYVRYGKASFPVYVGNDVLKLIIPESMVAFIDEADPRMVVVEEDFSSLPL